MKNRLSPISRRLKRISKQKRNNFLVLGLAVFVFFCGAIILWVSTFKIPTLESFSEREVVESTKIYDRTGTVLLYDVNQDIKRTVVPFENISRNVKNATIAIEDRNFYEHNGVQPISFLRAVIANIFSLSFSQGGSTITQQVVKNALLTKDKQVSRKIKEWVLAIRLEKILTKDEILNLYLNEIPYGGPLYGIEEASQAFFGKPASDLSMAESAYLAALPQAPSYYSPHGKHRDALDNRKNLVLREMLENNFITEEEYENAKAEVVKFNPPQERGLKAPHFVFYVIEQLEQKYGEETVRNGGLRVITSLDYEMQKRGEEIAEKYAKENEETFDAENAAFVAMDPKTGHVLAMVGSRGYFNKDIQGNFNIATALRQPGSTFKPFVYATAFNKGYTPETVLFDVPTQFSTTCSPDNLTSENGCYAPVNYDGQYRGPMTLRNALAQSINIPSVEVLYLAGIRESIETSEKMGISTLTNPAQYGLTLVLGGGEVRLFDMVSAYGTFAAEGVRHEPAVILEVKDRSGEELERFEDTSKSVLPEETARMISSILSDNVARAPAYGQSSYLHFPNQDVAVKTGTTNDYRDAWIIGYTPNVVIGAWAGNNDNSPMQKKVAGFIVAPMWREYINSVLPNRPQESFTPPARDDSPDLKPVLRGIWQGGVTQAPSSRRNGRASEEASLTENVSGGIHSILHWVYKDDPRGPIPDNPSDDPQYRYWERAVERWLGQLGATSGQ